MDKSSFIAGMLELLSLAGLTAAVIIVIAENIRDKLKKRK